MSTSSGGERPTIADEVARIKRLLGLDVNRLAIGSDIEVLVTQVTLAGVQGPFDYTITGGNAIEFVNVNTTIGPAQTAGSPPPDTTPPAQVTGLSVTTAGDTALSVSWTANTEPDLNHYNVYRGTTSGFTVTPGVTTPTGTPTGNSFGDTGLTASTTYYYKVLAVDNSNNLGAISSQASGTTAVAGTITVSLDLQLNSSFTDSSPNAWVLTGSSSNGFTTPGAFGSDGWLCNSPVQPAVQPDNLAPGNSPYTNPAGLQMDVTTGFSISLWINPADISALSFRRVIMEKPDSPTQKWSLQIDSSGIVYFFVKKAGTDYKAQVSGFTTGSWQHVAATFNGATNAIVVYRNAVAGVSSSATAQYPGTSDQSSPSMMRMIIGNRPSSVAPDAGDGSDFNTHYEGGIDEVKYYKSKVLTPTQITNLKNTNAP